MTVSPLAPQSTPPAISTVGELRASGHQLRSIREEMRDNLLGALREGRDPWPGLHGFEDTVIPQLERALIAGHDVVLLGERGQGKTRILRTMIGLLDEWSPVIAGSELGEHPLEPITVQSKARAAALRPVAVVEERGVGAGEVEVVQARVEVAVAANDDEPSSTTAEVRPGIGGALLGVGLLSALVNLLYLTGSLFMLEVYDRVLPSRSVPTLLGLAAIVLVLYGFQGLFDVLRNRLLVRIGASVDRAFGRRTYDAVAAERGRGLDTGLARLHTVPRLTQHDYDHLLWSCDLNFVRGEDSLVRALWAGKPFVWHIYPQHDNAHHAKLEAFLDWLEAPPSLRDFHRAWNGIGTAPAHWPGWAEVDRWREVARAARSRLLAQEDLATQFAGWVSPKG